VPASHTPRNRLTDRPHPPAPSVDRGPHSAKKPRVMAGAALALGLMAYGIIAKRRMPRGTTAQDGSLRLPGAIAKRDWWMISRRVIGNMMQKHISFVAAGAAYGVSKA